jgi:hypothetical protein
MRRLYITPDQYAAAYSRYYNRKAKVTELARELGCTTNHLYSKFGDIRHGRTTHKVSVGLVVKIMADRAGGDKVQVIASRYGIALQTTYKILAGKYKGKAPKWSRAFSYRTSEMTHPNKPAIREMASMAASAEDYWELAAQAAAMALKMEADTGTTEA